MSLPASVPGASNRWWLWLILGGGCLLPLSCGAVALCLSLAGLATVIVGGAPPRSAARGPALNQTAPAGDLTALTAEFEALPAGDAAAGAVVFAGEGGCRGCHALTPETRIVGPSLAGVAARAAQVSDDYSAELYLYEALVEPDVQVAAGFPAHVMPANFRQRLSAQQLADIVAFLLTQ